MGEILARIRACDAFVAVVSEASAGSLPCARELAYATLLGKPLLPVRVGPTLGPGVLPHELARRQLLDHADDKASALRLARALTELPAASPLPDPLPPAPEAPLSYTSELASLVHSPEALAPDAQTSLVRRLAPGLQDRDPDAAADCRALLVALRERRDVDGAVEREIAALLAAPAPRPRPRRPRPPRRRAAGRRNARQRGRAIRCPGRSSTVRTPSQRHCSAPRGWSGSPSGRSPTQGSTRGSPSRRWPF